MIVAKILRFITFFFFSVSIGGAVNLFVGATVVSFAEFINHFTLILIRRYVVWAISKISKDKPGPQQTRLIKPERISTIGNSRRKQVTFRNNPKSVNNFEFII